VTGAFRARAAGYIATAFGATQIPPPFPNRRIPMRPELPGAIYAKPPSPNAPVRVRLIDPSGRMPPPGAGTVRGENTLNGIVLTYWVQLDRGGYATVPPEWVHVLPVTETRADVIYPARWHAKPSAPAAEVAR
jgi:hypothetical protein